MINVKKLSLNYGKNEILKDVSFKVKASSVSVILGPNGVGKTALLRCITGINKYSGEIQIYDKNNNTIKNEEGYKYISYLSQDTSCNAVLTVFETILIGKLQSLSLKVTNEDIDKVEHMMEKLKISHLADRYINEISGGQRQMVFIAQALMKEPTILLMDELTSSLDLNKQFQVLDFIKKYTCENNITTLLTLHHLDLAKKYADDIIILNNKGVYATGMPKQVMTVKMFKEVYKVNAEMIERDNESFVIIKDAI